MAIQQHIFKLKGKVQHYAWGGYQYIPALLNLDNNDEKPFAEYWLGAHPNHPATIEVEGGDLPLNQFIQQHTEVALGSKVANRFGSLPFLLKVLDVKQMLSIQVHPSKASAEAGFEAENSAGIAVTAAHRNYKDDNHKP